MKNLIIMYNYEEPIIETCFTFFNNHCLVFRTIQYVFPYITTVNLLIAEAQDMLNIK